MNAFARDRNPPLRSLAVSLITAPHAFVTRFSVKLFEGKGIYILGKNIAQGSRADGLKPRARYRESILCLCCLCHALFYAIA